MAKAKKKAAKKPAKRVVKKAAKRGEAVPKRYGSATPSLVVSPASEALGYYQKAFGAKVLSTMPGPGGVIMHAEIQIGDSIIMMGEENPQYPCKSAETTGVSPISFYLYVENVDELFRRAVAAGAEARMPVEEMFWGDRVGSVQDPFGYGWSIATHVRDLTPAEMAEGARAAFARMAQT